MKDDKIWLSGLNLKLITQKCLPYLIQCSVGGKSLYLAEASELSDDDQYGQGDTSPLSALLFSKILLRAFSYSSSRSSKLLLLLQYSPDSLSGDLKLNPSSKELESRFSMLRLGSSASSRSSLMCSLNRVSGIRIFLVRVMMTLRPDWSTLCSMPK